MIKPNKSRFKKREFAQTMVEFAIVFPIVLLITYGLIEFGRMTFSYIAVNGAAREGARYGVAAGTVDGLPQFADCSGIAIAAQSKAFLTHLNSITISYLLGLSTAPTAVKTCTDIDNDPDLIKPGDRIKVSVTAHYTPWIAFLGISGFDIKSTNIRTILVDIPVDLHP